MSHLPLEIAPTQVKQMLDDGQPLCLVDVREQAEYQICRIEGAELIPMNTVPMQLQHLESEADEKLVVVYCHHGVRSLNVVNWLRGQGIENCTSMAGGIDLWSAQIDSSVPRY